MSLIVDGVALQPPGLEVVSWLDDKRIPRTTDGRKRKREAVTAVVLHTTKGLRSVHVREGSIPSTRAEALARYQASTTRDVSWHFTVDFDGTVVQSADPATWTCWHAGSVNGWTIGVELVQGDAGELYQVEVDAAVRLVDRLCEAFGIERRVPVDAHGRPLQKVVPRLTGAQGPWSGVFGHRHQTTNRGPGDPGDPIFDALLAAGFDGVTP